MSDRGMDKSDVQQFASSGASFYQENMSELSGTTDDLKAMRDGKSIEETRSDEQYETGLESLSDDELITLVAKEWDRRGYGVDELEQRLNDTLILKSLMNEGNNSTSNQRTGRRNSQSSSNGLKDQIYEQMK
jgi:hypothetical protein